MSTRPSRQHDVCIIGSGFAGAFLALRLVEHGVDTVLVEAGGDLPPDGPPDGRTDLFPHASAGGAAFPVDFNRSIGVGGTSRKWNGVLSRLQDTDLRSRTQFGLFEDWPIDLADLEPYYELAERALASRAAEVVPPAEGLRVPGPSGGDLELFPVPFSQRGSEGAPIRLRDVEIPRLLASPHGTLLTERPATRLVTTADGDVAGVEVQRSDGGTLETIGARRVVVAAGVMETVRLLLVSATPTFPRGIGNEHDLLGRHVHAHPRPRLHVPRPAGLAGRRGLFRTLRYCDELRRRGMASVCVDLNLFEEDPSLDITLETEPAAGNRIRLDPARRDRWGRPLAVLEYEATEIDRRTLSEGLRIQGELAARMTSAGGRAREADLKVFHPAGGCRMAREARQGVVDANGRVFGTRNLYVAGAAVFPTSGAANPTLTIVALAYRLGDHLAAQRWAS